MPPPMSGLEISRNMCQCPNGIAVPDPWFPDVGYREFYFSRCLFDHVLMMLFL